MRQILTLLFLVSVALARGQGNLLQNGSFENPTNSEPTKSAQLDNVDSWQSDKFTGTSISYDEKDCHSPDWGTSKSGQYFSAYYGQGSPNIAAPNGDNYVHFSMAELIQQELTGNLPEKDETYVLSFYIRLVDYEHWIDPGTVNSYRGDDAVSEMNIKSWLKKTEMKYDERDFEDALALYHNNNMAWQDYDNLNNSQEIMSKPLSDLPLGDSWHFIEVEFTVDDDNYDWFIMDLYGPHMGVKDLSVMVDDIKITKGCLDKCLTDNLIENRSLANNPVNTVTKAKELIKAGKSVDPASVDGEVIIGTGEKARFYSGKDIILEDGFYAYGDFYARIDPNTCDNAAYDCGYCCDEWDGYQPANLTIPTVVDRDEMYWQIKDYGNANCAYNTSCYRLQIWDGAGKEIEDKPVDYSDTKDCCPFSSPSSPSDDALASIRYEFSILRTAGSYNYRLELCGPCGENLVLTGTFFVNLYDPEPGPNTTGMDGSVTDQSLSIEVYPNPASDKLNVRYDGNVHGARVIDRSGREVMELGSSSLESIDISGLASGSYFLMLNTATTVEVRGFLKK